MRFLNVLVLLTLVGIAGCESREEARRKQAANNLKQIRLAMDAYQAKHAEAKGKEEKPGKSDHVPVAAARNGEDAERRADKMMKISGEVAEFHQSPDGEVDGITLKDGTEVRFPPQAGKNVAATVSIGDQVEVTGWTHAGESEIHAATIANVGSSKAVDVDEPPPGVPE